MRNGEGRGGRRKDCLVKKLVISLSSCLNDRYYIESFFSFLFFFFF